MQAYRTKNVKLYFLKTKTEWSQEKSHKGKLVCLLLISFVFFSQSNAKYLTGTHQRQ